MNRFERTERLLGADAMKRLAKARVAVFGIGGVGGYVVEALVRSGIGAIDIIDKDVVDITNLNRQIIATQDAIGRSKVEVMAERIAQINPECTVRIRQCFFLPETASEFDFTEYDYVIDAVDTVTAKIQIVLQATDCGTPVISCMGTGNKTDPAAFMVADISKTSVCPLAKVMRKELRKRGVSHLKVVYSQEQPVKAAPPATNADGLRDMDEESMRARKVPPGSVSFVPPVAGFILASEAVKDIARCEEPAESPAV